MRIHLIVVALFAGVVAVSCRAHRPKLSEHAFESTDFAFKSGLRLVVQRDDSAPIVASTLYFGTGASADPEGLEGLAHVVEHMLFRARHMRGNEQTLISFFRSHGVEFNAFTSYDETAYLEVASNELLPVLLQIAQARMLFPLGRVTVEDFEAEREVVRSELRSGKEGGGVSEEYNKIFEWSNASVFPPGHPYHRSVIGSHESLSRMTFADVRAFVEKHYRPDNATMVVVGDIDIDEVRATINRMWQPELVFGDTGEKAGRPLLDEPPPPRLTGKAPEPPDPPAPGEVLRHAGPVDTPTWVFTWSLPGGYRLHDTTFAVAAYYVHDQVLRGLETVDRNLLLWLGGPDMVVLPDTGVHASTVTVIIRMAPHVSDKQIDEVREAALKNFEGELPASWGAGFKHGASKRMKATLLTRQLMRAEQVASLFDGRAVRLAPAVHHTGDVRFFSNWMKQLGELGVDDVRGLVAGLTQARAGMVLVTPRDEPEPVAGGHFDAQLALEEPAVDAPTTVIPERIEKLVFAPEVSDFDREVLPNGLTVIAGRHGSMPLVAAQLIAHGGTCTSEPALLADLAWAFLEREDTAQLERAGGEVVSWMGRTSYRAHAGGPAGNLPEVLAALADYSVRTQVAPDHWRYRISETSRKVLEEWPNLLRHAHMARELFGRRVYAGHPLAEVIAPIASREAASVEWAEAWRAQVLAPNNTTLAIVGDIDPDEAIEQAAAAFGEWQGHGVGQVLAALPEPRGGGISIVHNSEATQTGVLVGCRLPEWKAETVRSYDVLGALLRRMFFRALREQGGATYGTYAWTEVLPGGAASLFASGSVDGPKTAEALRVILDAIDAVAEGEVDARIVVQEVESLARQHGLRLQTSESVARAICEATDQGLPLEHIDGAAEQFARVTRESLSALVRECTRDPVIVLEGNADAIATPLEEAGFSILERVAAPTREERNRARQAIEEVWETERRCEACGAL